MSKCVLIAVISCQEFPYGDMIGVSQNTWDSVHVDGCETLFYCGWPQKQNTDKIVYFNIQESLHSMGFKDLLFYDYALKNKEWDYMARVNSSCFVHKQNLVDYCQTLKEKEVFEGLNVVTDGVIQFTWGGGQFLISRDVIEKIVANKGQWNHTEMEDMAMSKLVMRLGITPQAGRACSIDAKGSGWTCMVYGHGSGFDFAHMTEFKFPEGQYFFRIKQDNLRHLEAGIMHELKGKL